MTRSRGRAGAELSLAICHSRNSATARRGWGESVHLPDAIARGAHARLVRARVDVELPLHDPHLLEEPFGVLTIEEHVDRLAERTVDAGVDVHDRPDAHATIMTDAGGRQPRATKS